MYTKSRQFNFRPLLFLLPSLFYLAGCQKNDDHHDNVNLLKDFTQVNLVANRTGYGTNTRIDQSLVNAWGIAFTANGGAWVNSQGGHVSEVYNSEGAQALPAVNIPSPSDLNGGGSPTGIIANPNTTDFVISSGNASPETGARFIFVGLDGVVAAWNGTWGNHSFRKFDRSNNSAYTGLALATNGSNNFLYAANFRSGKIDVWNKNWEPVSLPFNDPGLPAGYAPFNIQNIKNQLYVMYAKVAASGKNDPGLGKGFVDVFNPDGSFVRRVISRGQLNSPWGVALAPTSLFNAEEKIAQDLLLVGNFGDGHINVFRLSDGKLIGQLATGKKPIVIEGLWAISFPPTTSTVDPKRLYFAAGPAGETDGLFGYIIPEISDHPGR
jgi:uncharacterized protein (TIGR03118 family)